MKKHGIKPNRDKRDGLGWEGCSTGPTGLQAGGASRQPQHGKRGCRIQPAQLASQRHQNDSRETLFLQAVPAFLQSHALMSSYIKIILMSSTQRTLQMFQICDWLPLITSIITGKVSWVNPTRKYTLTVRMKTAKTPPVQYRLLSPHTFHFSKEWLQNTAATQPKSSGLEAQRHHVASVDAPLIPHTALHTEWHHRWLWGCQSTVFHLSTAITSSYGFDQPPDSVL